jgi:hypothetical protein
VDGEQWWDHERGSEYLASNPLSISGLPYTLKRCYIDKDSRQYTGWNVNDGAFEISSGRSNPALNTTDLFLKLPIEILYIILDRLPSAAIASLRLVTRTVRQLPIILFRRLLLEDMPWLWEAHGLAIGETEWWRLYQLLKFWGDDFHGLKNRARIWKDVSEIVNRIEKYREESLIRRWPPDKFSG